MLAPNLALLIIMLIGVLFGNKTVAIASGVLLVMEFAGLHRVVQFCESKAVDIGIVFLVMAVLSPFAGTRMDLTKIAKGLLSVPGVAAIIGGALATYVNGQGLSLLKLRPEVIVGLLIGTVIGVSCFHGIPVGPLTAAGVAALIVNLVAGLRR